jgi:hypothetical protein
VGAPSEPDGPRRPGRFSAEDRAAFFDARIAALHAGLRLMPDQEKMWPAVETVLRDQAKAFAAVREKMRNEPRPASPVEALQQLSDRSIERGQMLKKIVDAVQPLYASLSEEQKNRLPKLMHGMHPHFWHHRHEHMAFGGDGEQGPSGWWHRFGHGSQGDGDGRRDRWWPERGRDSGHGDQGSEHPHGRW